MANSQYGPVQPGTHKHSSSALPLESNGSTAPVHVPPLRQRQGKGEEVVEVVVEVAVAVDTEVRVVLVVVVWPAVVLVSRDDPVVKVEKPPTWSSQ